MKAYVYIFKVTLTDILNNFARKNKQLLCMDLLPSCSMPAGVRGAAGGRRGWRAGVRAQRAADGRGAQASWRSQRVREPKNRAAAWLLDAPAVICSLWGGDHAHT